MKFMSQGPVHMEVVDLGQLSDSQANQQNQTKALPATKTLKQKAASSEQMMVLCLHVCVRLSKLNSCVKYSDSFICFCCVQYC